MKIITRIQNNQKFICDFFFFFIFEFRNSRQISIASFHFPPKTNPLLALVKGEREKTRRAEKMTESEGKREKMLKEKNGGSLLVFTGGAAVLAIAANLAIAALRHRREKNAKKKGTSSS